MSINMRSEKQNVSFLITTEKFLLRDCLVKWKAQNQEIPEGIFIQWFLCVLQPLMGPKIVAFYFRWS